MGISNSLFSAKIFWNIYFLFLNRIRANVKTSNFHKMENSFFAVSPSWSMLFTLGKKLECLGKLPVGNNLYWKSKWPSRSFHSLIYMVLGCTVNQMQLSTLETTITPNLGLCYLGMMLLYCPGDLVIFENKMQCHCMKKKCKLSYC